MDKLQPQSGRGMLAVRHQCQNRVILTAVAASILWLSPASLSSVASDSDAVLVVGDYSVGREEVIWYMQQQRTAAFKYASQKCGLGDCNDFWSRSCEGSTMRQILEKMTIDSVVRQKSEQQLFHELGLLPDVSYSAFLAGLAETNRRRAETVRTGGVIYGPVTYGDVQYYGHRMAGLRLQAMELLAKGQLSATDIQLKTFYEANKDTLFRKADTMTLDVITLQVADNGPHDLAAATRTLLGQVRAGTRCRAAVDAWSPLPGVKISYSMVENITAERLSEMVGDTNDMVRAWSLKAGQAADLVASGTTAYVMMCTGRDSGGYIAFETSRNVIRQRYLEEKYAQLLAERVGRTVVLVNKDNLARIEIK